MCISPKTLFTSTGIVKVNCGVCGECLNSKKKEWVFRCEQEMKQCKTAFFVTLTYAPELTPSFEGVEVLCKRDLQLLIKRLRKNYGNEFNFRYYALGEYGPTTFRPHYHLIFFIDKVFDLFRFRNIITKEWRFGFNTVSDCNSNRIGYIVGYMLPVSELSSFFKQFPPFHIQSLGIGKCYLTDSRIKHIRDVTFNIDCNVHIPAVRSEILYKTHLPRYYRDRIFTTSEKAQIKHCYKNDLKGDVEEAIRKYEQFFEDLIKIEDDETRSKKFLAELRNVSNREANRILSAQRERQKMIKKRKI